MWKPTSFLKHQMSQIEVIKKLWSFIKLRKTDSVGVTLLKYKGTLWSKPKDKVEILNEQFKFVFSNRTPDEPDPLVTERDRPYPDIDKLQIHQMVTTKTTRKSQFK